MKTIRNLLFSFTLILIIMPNSTSLFAQTNINPNIEWKTAAHMQDLQGKPILGLAGAINGVHKDVLIVAGGANFPEKMPWEGGQKKYYNTIQVLEKKGDNYSWNTEVDTYLPEPIAYCGVTSTDLGVAYVGGENKNGYSKKGYLLKWGKAKNEVTFYHLPDLPKALSNIALSNYEKVLYAVGGDETQNSSKDFYSLNLNETHLQWKRLADLPLALANATAVVQETKEGPCLFVFGGRTKKVSGISELHSTTFSYNFNQKQWKEVASITDGNTIMNYSAGAAVPLGKSKILLLGGDNGEIFHRIETYLSKIALAETTKEKEVLLAQKNELVTQHQGFYRGILAYDTITDSWEKIGELPFLTPVTTNACLWEEAIVLSNGEIKPGVRTPNIMIGKITE
ncbi:kelch repeat-containing protein [Flavobacterium sp. TSSA_36]|uniref:kelch repeat-containing protein n=1 Tax=Flavobacterium sp. TSSA_36 TaxID=3447669 RepID=UPI003F3D7A54